MRIRTTAADFLAGVLLSNAYPHLVMGVAGKRLLTPGRPDSSPGRNLAWAGMNLAGGAALLWAGGFAAGSQQEAERRLLTVSAGMFAKDAAGLAYELTLGTGRDLRPSVLGGDPA